ncbi:MAG TPA: DUF2905 domain-containing protein [Thermodesulfobacteriota bacterium]|nr:DUF2905 domain-containing protein [Thermodesulfobacteriota bacterium]
MPSGLARLLIITGLVIVVLGLLLLVAERIPWLGRLPGDIRIERGNWRIYIPLATSLLISLVLTILLNLFRR